MDDRDHRALGQRLELFHFQDEAAGMVFWHPRGLSLVAALERFLRERLAAHGYQEVRTPQVLGRAVWAASGHLEHFEGGMLNVEGHGALKPVSCPAHLQLFAHGVRSYRDLPLRFAEFGVVHRDEPSGSLLGLKRLRAFTQDDGHVFCAEDDAVEEVAHFLAMALAVYEELGLPAPHVRFASRPARRAGSDEVWHRAEALLREALRQCGIDEPEEARGEGAFYGPKAELVLHDPRGVAWQCGTVQLDLVMPERFGVQYVDREGRRRTPALLHRALVGSLERMLGILLEHHGGILPAWLAAEQVAVLPVSERQEPAATALASELRAAGLRVRLDADGTLSKRVRDAHELGIPHVAILGEREVSDGSVTLRSAAAQRSLPLARAVRELAESARAPV